MGVAAKLVEKHLARTEERLALLKEDFAAIEEIDAQLALYREDLGRDFRFRLADVDNVLNDFEKRGADFFEDTLRIGRIVDLVNQSRVKAEFEKKVVADLPQVVEKRVDEVIDWLVASDMRQWKAIGGAAGPPRGRARGADAGARAGRVRVRPCAAAGDGAAARPSARWTSYDKDAEGRRLAEDVRDAVAHTSVLQVGALGLGTIVTMLATSSAVDVTGIMAAGAISVLGLLILPARKRRATRELAEKTRQMRERLMGALTAQFDREAGPERAADPGGGRALHALRARGARAAGDRRATSCARCGASWSG